MTNHLIMVFLVLSAQDQKEDPDLNLQNLSIRSPVVVRKFDKDRNGVLDRAERTVARKFVHKKRSEIVKAKIEQSLENQFDIDNNGKLSKQERAAMDKSLDTAANAYVRALVRTLEVIGSGK